MADDLGESLLDGYRQMVEGEGDSVGLNSADCTIWKLEHSNCRGCPTEVGCAKVTSLMAISLIPLTYTAKDFDDHARMQRRMREWSMAIIKAKTVEEVNAVDWA